MARGEVKRFLESVGGDLMTVQIDVRPETAAKFQAAATALNLSLQEYLERLAVLIYSERGGEIIQSQDKTPYELGKDFIGKVDSSIFDLASKPHKTAFGELLLEKYKKQGLDLP
jgi:hypothetical protein